MARNRAASGVGHYQCRPDGYLNFDAFAAALILIIECFGDALTFRSILRFDHDVSHRLISPIRSSSTKPIQSGPRN